MEEVVGICQARSGGVMITCAGKKHCEQVAEFLPEDSWAIIVDSTSTKARSQSLADVRTGKIKYILQIGCLTTGINIPPLSTSVILRRIGSLTLLTQLIGRILRTLEDDDLERGFTKIDGLVLDYTDTFESFGDIYDDPMLDNARAAKGKFISETQDCPTCNSLNSIHAVRCIGTATNSDGRCDYFFKGSMCLRCDTMNAPTARTCRNCDAIMIDPAKALKNKAYTDADWKEVIFGSMSMKPTANKDGVCVEYSLNSIYTVNGKEMQEVAKEYLKPFSTAPHERQKWQSFVSTHINGRGFQAIMRKNTTINDIIKNKAMFCMPSHITHRVNDKGFSIINRRRFLSGREVN
jgi:ribosomal protein L40E